MYAFYYISQKIIPVANIYYPSYENMFLFYRNVFDVNNKNFFTEDYNKVYNLIYNIFYHNYYNNDETNENYINKTTFTRSKFHTLTEILENIFLTNEYKEDFLKLFCKIQKVYFAISRFAHIYRFKKSKLQINTDLSLSPIDQSSKNVITIFQHNSRYLFTINDLIHIIETSISNSPNFFLEILEPKNPYTNMPFDISTLYNIYFKHKQSSGVLSTLFHLFFLSNFNFNHYMLENESFIRDFAIKKYVFNTPSYILYDKIKHMLKSNKYTSKLQIHDEFPKDTLVNIMRPFLYYNYIYTFGVKPREKTYVFNKILYHKLKKFYQHNPQFGRILYKIDYLSKKRLMNFNTDHINFYSIHITPFELMEDVFETSSFQSEVMTYDIFLSSYPEEEEGEEEEEEEEEEGGEEEEHFSYDDDDYGEDDYEEEAYEETEDLF
jgi:hypothetical protein